MTKPISPSEVVDRQEELLPDHVIETWNRMIVAAWNGRSATITQKTAVKELGGSGGDGTPWLNIEDIYRKAGWVVVYDKPGYCETYEASFTFTKEYAC
jgi:hypothetical protein